MYKRQNHENENEETFNSDLNENIEIKEEATSEDISAKPSEETAIETVVNSDDEISIQSESRFQEFFSNYVETDKPKITDTLKSFIELKNVDEELTDIAEEKGDLPENIELIISKIDSFKTRIDIKREELQNLENEKAKLIETDNSYEERINKYDEQKFDVRSNKEYDEIIKTIESLFDEVKKNEIRIKEIDTITGTLISEIETLDTKFTELKTELEEKQTLLNELDEEFKQEESVLREKRNLLTQKLDAQSISLYDRINKMYKGEATAIVRKGNCSGCYNSIPPQRVIEIKAAEKIFTCQSCGRILISEELTLA